MGKFEVVPEPSGVRGPGFEALGTPVVKIIKSAPRLSLNQALRTQLDVQVGDQVVLLIDPGMGHVGIRPVRDGSNPPGALTINHPKGWFPGVSLRGLVTYHGLNYRDAVGVHRCTYLESERMWMFALPADTWNKVLRPRPGQGGPL